MKIFSIIFTVLFFLGFASTSSAEPEYTITNKSNARLSILFNNHNERTVELKSNECVKLTENQFYNLKFIFVQPSDSMFTTLCDEAECEPGNYEVHMKSFLNALFSVNDYTITAVDQANTGICPLHTGGSWER